MTAKLNKCSRIGNLGAGNSVAVIVKAVNDFKVVKVVKVLFGDYDKWL